MPAAKVRSARVAVTRVDPEVWVSPDPGERVDRATGEARAKALYTDEMDATVAHRASDATAQPVHVDLDFFDGRKGGHMSVSGISGVATKTSFALFFLRVLTASPAVRRRGCRQPARAGVQRQGRGSAVARPAEPAVRRGRARAGWAALGVDPTPFPSVRFWAPPRRQRSRRRPGPGHRWAARRASTCSRGRPREFIDEDLLAFCFTDATDARNQLPFIRERVQLQLRRWAVDVDGMPGAVALRDPSQAPEGRWRPGDSVPAAQAEVVIHDLPSLVAALERFLEPEDGGRSPTSRGPAASRPGRSRRSCAGCTRRRRGSGTWCVRARAGGSTAPPPP